MELMSTSRERRGEQRAGKRHLSVNMCNGGDLIFTVDEQDKGLGERQVFTFIIKSLLARLQRQIATVDHVGLRMILQLELKVVLEI